MVELDYAWYTVHLMSWAVMVGAIPLEGFAIALHHYRQISFKLRP
jgi:hypothetical protein